MFVIASDIRTSFALEWWVLAPSQINILLATHQIDVDHTHDVIVRGCKPEVTVLIFKSHFMQMASDQLQILRYHLVLSFVANPRNTNPLVWVRKYTRSLQTNEVPANDVISQCVSQSFICLLWTFYCHLALFLPYRQYSLILWNHQ